MRASRRSAIRTLGTIAAGTAVGVSTGAGVYGYRYERRQLDVSQTLLPISGLPPALSGLRIALLTDLHFGAFVSGDDIRRAVGAALAARPDLIVLGGDYVNWQDRTSAAACAEALTGIDAPQGVFAVLGNHDDERATTSAFRRRGIQLLVDARTRLSVAGEPIDLVGLRYWTRRAKDIIPLIDGRTGPVVLLAHDPRRLAEAAALDLSAVLSGHTHGGQVVLPVVGAIAARRFPIVAGLGQRDNTSIYVSRGIGTIVLPVRLSCPPEVAMLTLTARRSV